MSRPRRRPRDPTEPCEPDRSRPAPAGRSSACCPRRSRSTCSIGRCSRCSRPSSAREFQWSNAQYGYIAVAFNLGMMCGQIPAGALMDRVGTQAWGSPSSSSPGRSCGGARAGRPGHGIDSIGSVCALPLDRPGCPALSTLGAAGLAGFILLRFLMGCQPVRQLHRRHQGAGRSVSGRHRVERGRRLQRRRAVRVGHRARRSSCSSPASSAGGWRSSSRRSSACCG